MIFEMTRDEIDLKQSEDVDLYGRSIQRRIGGYRQRVNARIPDSSSSFVSRIGFDGRIKRPWYRWRWI
jgi:hypothetical protein